MPYDNTRYATMGYRATAPALESVADAIPLASSRQVVTRGAAPRGAHKSHTYRPALLQAALRRAHRGGVTCIGVQRSRTYAGSFTLPLRSASDTLLLERKSDGTTTFLTCARPLGASGAYRVLVNSRYSLGDRRAPLEGGSR